MTSIDYHEMPAPISESLTINQTPHSASCAENKSSYQTKTSQRRARFQVSNTRGIWQGAASTNSTLITRDQMIPTQTHEPTIHIQLTNSEKETIDQDILTYLWSHQEVPADLILDIGQKFTESNTQPTPTKLDIFNINELLDPSFAQTMDDYDTNNSDLPTTMITRKVHFDNNPEFIADDDKTHFDATQKYTHENQANHSNTERSPKSTAIQLACKLWTKQQTDYRTTSSLISWILHSTRFQNPEWNGQQQCKNHQQWYYSPWTWWCCKPMLQPSLQYSLTQTILIFISCSHGHWLWWLCHNWGVKIYNHVSWPCNKIQMDLCFKITYPQSHYCHTWIVPLQCRHDSRNILHWLWSKTNERKNSRLD